MSAGLRRRTRRVVGTVAALATAATLVGVGGTPAHAAGPTTWTELQAAFATGGTVTLGADLSAPSGERLQVASGTSVTLDLDGFALSVEAPRDQAAIHVPGGAALTVTDSADGGALAARGGAHGAAIGGDRSDNSSGTVTIEGGTVSATGGANVAGIGTGWVSTPNIGAGPVTVTGGVVEAVGGVSGAGIGGGALGAGGPVAITGGTVTARSGGDLATAVGGGSHGAGGQVTVGAQGDLTVVGHANSPATSAIGGSGNQASAFGTLSNAGTLTIPSGTLLKLPSGATVENSGTIFLQGPLQGLGLLTNTGLISGNGNIEQGGLGPAGTKLEIGPNNYLLVLYPSTLEVPQPATLRVLAPSIAAAGKTLPDLTWEGHDFDGWWTDASGGSRVLDDTDLATAYGHGGPVLTTLWARWDTPVVTGLTPTSGVMAGGTPITITGANLSDVTTVTVGESVATDVEVVSDTEVRAVTSSSGYPGQVPVRVANGTGVYSEVSDQAWFTYVDPRPVITGVSPNHGPVSGGTTVQITGRGFTGATKVRFGGGEAASYEVLSDNLIEAVTPVQAGGQVRVVVKLSATIRSAPVRGLQDRFTFARPTVTNLLPRSGPVTGGTEVTIRGVDLPAGARVWFGEAEGTVVSASTTEIVVTTPRSAGRTLGPVPLRVTTADGRVSAPETKRFTYLEVRPEISAITPASGPLAGGDEVLIEGDGLAGTTEVVFGTQVATVLEAENGRLLVRTPAGLAAGSVQVRVRTPYGRSPKSESTRFTYLR